MIAEFVPHRIAGCLAGTDQELSGPALCCLCLQATSHEDWIIIRTFEATSYIVCRDCAVTYRDEPERAYLEIEWWVSLIDEANKLP